MSTERNAQIIAKYGAGMTLQQVGQEYGLTRERVRQILALYGVERRQGGAALTDEGRRAFAERRKGKAGDAQKRAVDLVRAGATYGEAAALAGLTRSAVAGACHRAGVKAKLTERKAKRRRAMCSASKRRNWADPKWRAEQLRLIGRGKQRSK